MEALIGLVGAFIAGAIISMIPKKEMKLKENVDKNQRKGELFLIAFVVFMIAAIVFVLIDMNK